KFTGKPEQIVELFTAIAEDLRRELAAAGFRSVEDAVGRVDRLEAEEESPLDMAGILGGPAWIVPAARRGRAPRFGGPTSHGPKASPLDERLAIGAFKALETAESVALDAAVTPAERTVGAVLAGALARQPGPRAARRGGYRPM